MNSFMDLLKRRFNYSDKMLNFIKRIIPCLIEYYGEEYEGKIYTAFATCYIHFQEPDESTEKFLNDYFNDTESWKGKDTIRAFYQNKLFLKDKSKYIVSSKSLIYIMTNIDGKYVAFDFNDPDCINVLIHEICHLIKGIGNVRNENNGIVDSTGLNKVYYGYSSKLGFVELEEEFHGIEEAFNECDAISIQKMLTGKDYKINGYITAGNYALIINQKFPILAGNIRRAEMDSSVNWHETLNDETFKKITNAFEVLVTEMYKFSKSDNYTNEQIMRLIEAEKTLDDFIINYNENKLKDKFKLVLSKKIKKQFK